MVFRNVGENVYYFIAVECGVCSKNITDLVMENLTVYFDVFFLKLTQGGFHNLIFRNISKMEYKLFAYLWFQNHEFCRIRNVNYLVKSTKNKEIYISDFHSKNIHCLNGLLGKIGFEKEIFSLLSSDSYIQGASVYSILSRHSKLPNVQKRCYRFFNIDKIYLENIKLLSSKTADGGALAIQFAEELIIENLFTSQTIADWFG